MSVDEQLRGIDATPVLTDAEVDVRRATGIGDRLDRAEIVLAGGVGQKPAIALEIAVAGVRGDRAC